MAGRAADRCGVAHQVTDPHHGANPDAGGMTLASAYGRVTAHLVGRERELTLTLAAVAAGRDLILEGPPGTSKSTLLRAITAEWGIPLFFVEGNADLTPAKLIGHHNPARVLREDYSPDNFRVVASMNPYDNVGTTRLSTSVHDRICRLAIGYQDAAAERRIVALRAPLPGLAPALYARLVGDAVAVTRATREHQDIRQGSSVRGAIDLTLVAGQLLDLRGVADESYPELVYDAMVVALSGRIFLDETVEETPEAVLRQIWEDQFILAPAAAAPG
jgi:MoxR-like ATPase